MIFENLAKNERSFFFNLKCLFIYPGFIWYVAKIVPSKMSRHKMTQKFKHFFSEAFWRDRTLKRAKRTLYVIIVIILLGAVVSYATYRRNPRGFPASLVAIMGKCCHHIVNGTGGRDIQRDPMWRDPQRDGLIDSHGNRPEDSTKVNPFFQLNNLNQELS